MQCEFTRVTFYCCYYDVYYVEFQIFVERGHCAMLCDRQRAPHRPQPRIKRQRSQRRRGRRCRGRLASRQERCSGSQGTTRL